MKQFPKVSKFSPALLQNPQAVYQTVQEITNYLEVLAKYCVSLEEEIQYLKEMIVKK